MLYEVKINGFSYFADIYNKILYVNREKTSGTPFSYLTKNEIEQLEKEIRFLNKR